MWDRPIKVHVIKEEDTFTGRGGTLDRVLFDKRFWSTMGPVFLILIGLFLILIGVAISPFSLFIGIVMAGLGIFFIYKKFKKRMK